MGDEQQYDDTPVVVRWRWRGNNHAATATYRGFSLAVWRDAMFWGRAVTKGAEEIDVSFHAMFSSYRAMKSAIEIAHHTATGRRLDWPAITLMRATTDA